MNALELAADIESLGGPYGDVASMLRNQDRRIERLETALSECRDAMPSPAPGERQEQSWSEAIGDPLAVPAYVKETVLRLESDSAGLKAKLESMTKVKNFIEWGGL